MKRLFTLLTFSLLGITSLSGQCNTVNVINENFDNSKSVPSCWETKSGLSMIYVKNKRVTFYSLMTPREDMYLITPKLKAGNYTISMDMSDNGGETSLELIAIANTDDKKNFVSLSKPTEIKDGKRIQNFKLKKDAHLGLKVGLNDMHQAVYVDNILIKSKR